MQGEQQDIECDDSCEIEDYDPYNNMTRETTEPKKEEKNNEPQDIECDNSCEIED